MTQVDTIVEPAAEYGRTWSVLADPEGGEFCVFERDPATLGDYRLFEMVIDCVDPRPICEWWAGVLGCEVGGNADNDWWWLLDIPGAPMDS